MWSLSIRSLLVMRKKRQIAEKDRKAVSPWKRSGRHIGISRIVFSAEPSMKFESESPLVIIVDWQLNFWLDNNSPWSFPYRSAGLALSPFLVLSKPTWMKNMTWLSLELVHHHSSSPFTFHLDSDAILFRSHRQGWLNAFFPVSFQSRVRRFVSPFGFTTS